MHSTTVRSRLFILISFSLFCLLFVGCAAREQAVPERSYNGISVGESWQTIQSGQDERKYLLYVPVVYDGSTPFPLVLNFHGRGSNPSAQLAYSDFIELAEEKGYVTALPLGQYNYNGMNSWNTVNDPDDVDDVQLARDIISDLETRLSIDPGMIYATGMSAGARMTSRLACELDGTLAAVAPVAGVQFPVDCQADRAVPIITFHGKQDVINTYVHSEDSRPYWISGVEDSLAGWVDKNGCAENPSIEIVTDAVDRLRWGGCRDGAEIVFYSIADGGHTWPGSSIVLTSPWSGKTSKDITATQLIWDFLSAHPLP
jgi:polyhydroxybutyrate depolymerase